MSVLPPLKTPLGYLHVFQVFTSTKSWITCRISSTYAFQKYGCVTSRPEIDIRVAFEPLSSFQLSLHDETGQKQDIASYIRYFIASSPNMQRWRAEDKELAIEVLTLRNQVSVFR